MLHLSAAESVVAVERAKAAGIEVTAEVTPHHLTLTDEAVRSLDPRFKMNPPLRGERDRQALIDGLAVGRRSTASRPTTLPTRARRRRCPFEQAPMGVTGLETAFPVLYTDLVLPGVIELGCWSSA